MPSTFDGLPQRTEETGRLWVYVFGRWTPVADEGDDGAGSRPG